MARRHTFECSFECLKADFYATVGRFICENIPLTVNYINASTTHKRCVLTGTIHFSQLDDEKDTNNERTMD